MADLSEAQLARASFAGAHLHGTDFGRAQGEGAIFKGAGGEKTSFEGGVWTEARFDDASRPSCDSISRSSPSTVNGVTGSGTR